MNTKKIIIVLGMHRSGTSALTRGLSTMGVALSDDLHPAGPDNPTGFWEDSDVIAINNQILGLLGSAHDRMGVIDANVFELPGIQEIYDAAKALVTQKTTSTSMWGIKDPRITRLLPFWQKLLNELGFEIGYVIALRNPLNVAASLTARNQLPPVKSYILWLEHMLQAVACTHSESRLIVSYDYLLSDPGKQLLRMSSTLGLQAPTPEELASYSKEFLDTNLRHGQHDDDELLKSHIEPAILAQTYELLRECALDELSINSDEFEQQFQPLMSALRRMQPMLQLASQAEAATVAANEEIVARDRQIEALNTHIQHLNHNNEIYLATDAGKSSSFTALKHEQSLLVSALSEQTARNNELTSELGQCQSALEQATVHKESLKQHVADLTLSLNTVHGNLLTTTEQVDTLSNAWATFFVSRTWKLFRVFNKKATRPVIPLPEGNQFDDKFYLRTYPDVAASTLSAREHFLGAGLREGRQASASPAPSARLNAAILQSSALVEVSGEEERKVEKEEDVAFDRDFYLAMYPDIADCGIKPEQHFLLHGRHEGRIGTVPQVKLSRPLTNDENGKPTVLLVSHEASRTGAPILSLNVAQHLTQRFNVVALLLGPGSLTEAFLESGAIVAGPLDRSNAMGASLAVSKFLNTHKIDFAIVNSLESNVVLKPLAERFIPAVSLIHEFAIYTRPQSAIQNALLWASQTVFSSRATLDSAVQALPQLGDRSIPVLAQGKSIVPGEAQDEKFVVAEKRRLQHAMRPKDQDADTIVILGAGRVQLRKGVDIFIECATRVINSAIGHKCRFVWIGDNYDPEIDIAYSVYLQDQIQRSGIAEQFKIITETAQIEEVYAMSDMLLLSSRLDPLPNVAIDAMLEARPVLCFDRTTGIAEILKRNDLESACVAPYLDTGDMADKIIRLASSDSVRADVGERVKAIATREFNMPDYVAKLVDIATQLEASSRQEQQDSATISEAGVLDIDYYTPANVHLKDADEAVRRYVRSWSRGILRRKPFPGFDPSLYQELNADAVGLQDPLAHFLHAGRPQGPWNQTHFDWNKPHPALGDRAVLLYLSVESPQHLLNALDKITVSGVRVTVIVLTSDEAMRVALHNMLETERSLTLDIRVYERGSLWAMLEHLTEARYQDYDLVGHIDLQTDPVNPEFTSRSAYHHFLIENMIDGKHLALRTIASQLSDPDSAHPIGLVFPDDPNISHLASDEALLASLCKAIDIQKADYEHQPYPVNGAFLGTPETLSPLVGSLSALKSATKQMHLSPQVESRIMARLLPQACASKRMHMKTTVVAGVTY
ncbi:glycosyltransferase [Pseudomonas gozinkensis]|uniref:glycosyltransferase n=1 Tax=Pseudomonas gozinkensis TaxID=2774461 RepID=UPI0017880B94|nr:glycosyltransferase [Pseudomonas gozinkensis]